MHGKLADMKIFPLHFNGNGSPIAETAEGLHPTRVGSDGTVGQVDGYIRVSTVEKMTPPYVIEGRIKPISNPGRDGVFFDGKPVWYSPAIVVHPIYGTTATPAVGNNENVLFSMGSPERPGRIGCSAELRDERPEQPYGTRSGYESREFGNCPIDFYDSQWHTIRVEVDSVETYRMFYDGILMADVTERQPATIRPGQHEFALRLDFCNVVLSDWRATEPNAPDPEVPMIYPREFWQDPAKPVSGPAPKGEAHTWVIHYPAGKIAPTGDAVPPFLRGVQSSYLHSRNYSIGYSWGVAQDGSKWEIRGDDYSNAANAGEKVEGNFNNVSRSIFVMVAHEDEASPAAVKSINEIIATHPDWNVITHGDVDFTSCCGAGLIRQVRAGIIGQQDNPPTPEPPGDEEEIMIAYIGMPPAGIPNNPPWLLCVNGAVRYATNVDTQYATDNQWAFVELNAEQYPLLLKGAGLA